jgi:P-type Ca2+ transporter type 2C
MINPTLLSHTATKDIVLENFKTTESGLSQSEAEQRLKQYGANLFPTKKKVTVYEIFFQQFLNPLIYILALAALVSIALDDYSDAFFIIVVLLINAIIGTIQEFSAEKSAQALMKMAASKCMVERGGEIFELDAERIVIGDIVLLESGRKVPADLRLITSHNLEIDESLLTGESLAVIKDHSCLVNANTSIADRKNMAFTGSLVIKGRAKGVVIATALQTELGKIADSISSGVSAKPPLIIRMEKFTKKIAIFLVIVTSLMAIFLLLKGQSWHDVMMFAVALSVSAIPEGLPVALTIALAVASRNMAKRNVIVRKLPAVESLGSCTYIATDKTGTLTVNQMTIAKICIPNYESLSVTGSGLDPQGEVLFLNDEDYNLKKTVMALSVAGALCNEGQLLHKDNQWQAQGDAVDVAFLVLTHKLGRNHTEVIEEYNLISEVPFEPENQYAAVMHTKNEQALISVKGSVEKLLLMCTHMQSQEGVISLNPSLVQAQAEQLAQAGYRVLALAHKNAADANKPLPIQLEQMVFLGLVAMIDPLRPEAKEAVKSCLNSGIRVAMVTGDHPQTALAIARELGLATDLQMVVTGPSLKLAKSNEIKNEMIKKARVFARVEPKQKLEIVQTLIDQGHFVAVTGDGANDAPALRAANVGVAMGKNGTDIAKETSDLILADDRFASIVAGIEEGRVAYNNVRKVTYLLISTGAAEIILFILSLIFNTPLPLTAVQILWLNLVTNGIQHVGLAFEQKEGDELARKPRSPSEPIFDRLMLERIFISAMVMGVITFTYFYYLIQTGMSEFSARNLTLLLLVLFENVMVGNCRSETRSAFSMNPFRNKLLLGGTMLAQMLHLIVLYIPGMQKVLNVEPVYFEQWIELGIMALSVLFVMELYKLVRAKFKLHA